MANLRIIKRYSEFAANFIGDLGILYLLIVLFSRGSIESTELILAFGTLLFRLVVVIIKVIEIYT